MDEMKPYIPPTDEEIEQVRIYWSRVEQSLLGRRAITIPDVPPDEVLSHVAFHHHRLEVLACTHNSITVDSEGVRCGECDRPMKFLSDYQILKLQEDAIANAQF